MIVDDGIVKQVDVASPGKYPRVGCLDTAPALPPGAAADPNNEIADQNADGMRWFGCDNAGNEMLAHTLR